MSEADNLRQALRFHQAGQLEQAKTLYQRVLTQQPQHADGLNLMGVVARQQNRNEEAIGWIRRAIEINRSVADFHFNLGEALRASGKLEEAIAEYEESVRLRPGDGEVQHALGIALAKQGRNPQAIEAFEHALRLRPDLVQAYDDLASSLLAEERVTEAKEIAQASVQAFPMHANAHFNLGTLLLHQRQHADALSALKRAVEIKPDWPEAHLNAASALEKLGRYTEALEFCRMAIRQRPKFAEAYNLLGLLLEKKNMLSEADDAYQRAIEAEPTLAEAYSNLGNNQNAQAKGKEAISLHRKAAQLKPELASIHSNLLMSLNYDEDATAERVFAEHEEWGRRFASREVGEKCWKNVRQRDKCLRVGYVSPDFRDHPVASFIENVLASHDRNTIETICYSNVARPDHVSERLRQHAQKWVDVHAMTDQRMLEAIEEDEIDILVDLAGHTAGNRLLVFAAGAAPVQITYLGYPNTSGIPREQMRYRISDAHADPPGMTEQIHSEELLRLPQSFLCYRGPDNSPDPAPAPCLKNGFITFGSFNQLAKLNSVVIDLWSRVLQALPNSRLMLKAKGFADARVRERVSRAFAGHGISASRIDLIKAEPAYIDHLRCYGQVDAALDPHPYNGTTTSCEAMWMGVPLITLAGDTHRSRVGVSLLANVGLRELIASTAEDYVRIAGRLAENSQRLSQLRAQMRQLMRESALLQPVTFTRNLENSYRSVWQTWCSHRSHQ